MRADIEKYLEEELRVLEQFARHAELFESSLWQTFDNVLEQVERGVFERLLHSENGQLETWRELIKFVRVFREMPSRMAKAAAETAQDVQEVESFVEREERREEHFLKGTF